MAEARRIALAAQGFTDRRPPGRVDRRHLRRVFDRINVIQVDSVNVLVRSQELPLFARLGPHPRTMIADAIDDGTLVLPGHGMPFEGPASRAAETRLHHERRLAAIEAEISRPRTGYDVASVLFPRAMGGAHERLAISETVAHLNHAVVTGRLTRETGADGVHRYATA